MTPLNGIDISCHRRLQIKKSLGDGLAVGDTQELDEPDLPSSDFHLFGPLKQHLGGNFVDDGKSSHTNFYTDEWTQSKTYAAGIWGLIKCYSCQVASVEGSASGREVSKLGHLKTPTPMGPVHVKCNSSRPMSYMLACLERVPVQRLVPQHLNQLVPTRSVPKTRFASNDALNKLNKPY
ncbi:hypothetical protein AVEN_134612-1 [Araneus ventricosus]|uniref:Uncharacterized protein n=1 Tax=Araneus ventricosus TaxID=182803 RepID=A0A4Y2TUB0_ARAVE|nr:hypothetical protein AVEN_134612-1 [Araneus ventricosus]